MGGGSMVFALVVIGIVLFIWLSQAAMASAIAGRKGRSSFGWYWLGLLLPFFGLLLALVINPSADYLAASESARFARNRSATKRKSANTAVGRCRRRSRYSKCQQSRR